MSLKSYLTIMFFSTFLCWLIFIFVIFNVNPFTTSFIGFFLFYSSLFLAVAGTSAIIGFIVRFIGLKQELVFNSVKIAFRQSFLFAFLIVAILFLNSHQLFTWINLFFLVASLSVLELFLINYNKDSVNL